MVFIRRWLQSDNTSNYLEDFYEAIEAPQFVDFTTPERLLPDDRYWFCARLGCNLEHEREIDPEEIYKKFVRRVMAARSPNVKLQKALERKGVGVCSKKLVGMLSAPPKVSKPKLAEVGISSSPLSSTILHRNGGVSSMSKLYSSSSTSAKRLFSVENETARRPDHNALKKSGAVRKEVNTTSTTTIPLKEKCGMINTLEIGGILEPLQERTNLSCTKRPSRPIRRDYNRPWCQAPKKVETPEVLLVRQKERNNLENPKKKSSHISNGRFIQGCSSDGLGSTCLMKGDAVENDDNNVEKENNANNRGPHLNVVLLNDVKITTACKTPTTAGVRNYRKLKATNPKPFKLRTDERSILKEAKLKEKGKATPRSATSIKQRRLILH